MDLKDIESIALSLEIYSQSKNSARFKQELILLIQKIKQQNKKLDFLLEENNRLRLHVQDLSKKNRELNLTLRQVLANYQAGLKTFLRFKRDIELVQKMRSLKELPNILAQIKEYLALDAVGLILSSEYFATFVPDKICVYPQEDIQSQLLNLPSISLGDSYYMGCIAKVKHFSFFWPELNGQKKEQLKEGSCFIYVLKDKYNPENITGVLALGDKDIARYSPEKATDFLEHFCYIFSCTLLSVREHEKLDREKVIDTLTGIHNREYFHRHAPRILDFATRRGFPVCLLFMDLDGFKSINDNLGHNVGDKVLIEVAQRIQAVIRKYDIFVRLAGDEFLILLPDTDLEQAQLLKMRVQEAIKCISIEKLCGQPTDLTISVSVGLAQYVPGQEIKDFLKVADDNMYAEKKQQA
jgi:diguanylate cyclase (GGDEF)-like protein